MYEIQDHLIICLDNEYISKEVYDNIWNLSINTIKVLDDYIRYLNKKAENETEKRIEKRG